MLSNGIPINKKRKPHAYSESQEKKGSKKPTKRKKKRIKCTKKKTAAAASLGKERNSQTPQARKETDELQ